jgi:hypothetical protein
MSKLITITTLSGTSPFDVYLCDNTYGNCIFISTINNIEIPYSFLVPSPYLSLLELGVKVVDNNQCEIKNKVSF